MVVSTYLAGKTPEQYSILAVFLLVFYFHDLEAGLGSLGSTVSGWTRIRLYVSRLWFMAEQSVLR